jgi:hypothetical protein
MSSLEQFDASRRLAVGEEPKTEREIDEEAVVHSQLLAAIPGGTSLISQLGYVPEFHDAIVREMRFSICGPSSMQFWLGGANVSKDGLLVTFDIEAVLDMNLDYFRDNIMFEMLLRRPTVRPERTNYLHAFAHGDLEFEFRPSFGMQGFLVARGVSLHWHPE